METSLTKEIVTITQKIDTYTSQELNGRRNNARKVFDEIMLKHNFIFVGSGLDRIVYANENFAIKIEVGLNNQNEVEVKRFLKLSDRIREFYIPILAYDTKEFKWIVVPRAKTVECNDFVLIPLEESSVIVAHCPSVEGLRVVRTEFDRSGAVRNGR